MDDDDKWNSYFQEGTDVLKNKLGIIDKDLLKQKEYEIVLYKLSYLILNGMDGEFDSKHLCDIHRFLFSDIYYFAGEYRYVKMSKITEFEHPEVIPLKLEEVMNEFNNQEVINTRWYIAKHLAEYHNTLIDIHPFREGNGRCIREFLRQYVLYRFKEYELDYSHMNKKHLIDYIRDPDSYPNLIVGEFLECLILKEKEKTK